MTKSEFFAAIENVRSALEQLKSIVDTCDESNRTEDVEFKFKTPWSKIDELDAIEYKVGALRSDVVELCQRENPCLGEGWTEEGEDADDEQGEIRRSEFYERIYKTIDELEEEADKLEIRFEDAFEAVRIEIDFENNDETFWDQTKPGAVLRAMIEKSGNDNRFYLDPETAADFREKCEACETWNDGPEYAETPLIFYEFDDDFLNFNFASFSEYVEEVEKYKISYCDYISANQEAGK